MPAASSHRFRLLICLILGILLWVCLRWHPTRDDAVAALESTALAPPAAETLSKWAERYREQLPPPAQLRADPHLLESTLENGIRCVILEQPNELHQVSLRLLVLAGSMHEEPSERGLAHLVEHLAFGKSRQDPQGNFLQAMERLGLQAGADANATTSYASTIYKLDLPEGVEQQMESGLTFFRSVADGLAFAPEAVAQEKSIVLREMAERKSEAVHRVRTALFPTVRAFDHPPIGEASILQAATPDQLRAYWQREYVASRLVVVAVGALSCESTLAQI